MKENALTAGRWIAMLILVALLGLLAVLGLGRKRGGRLQRLRVNLWVAIVGLMAGGGIFVAAMTACGGKSRNAPPPSVADAGVAGDASQVTPGPDELAADPPLAMPSCYSPPPCYVPPPGDLKTPEGPVK